MSIIFVLLTITVILAVFFALIFVASAFSGQFDDLEKPAHQIMTNERGQNET